MCPDVLEQSLEVCWEGDFGNPECFGFPIRIKPTLGKDSCVWPWAAARAVTPIPVHPSGPLFPAAATPLALTLDTCVGSGDPALQVLDDFPRKCEGGNCFIEILALTRAE